MAKKNTKSRYWVDDNSILPEIVVTPQGNYPVLDEIGNPARTVGAIQDINPNAHIYERVNTQPFMDDYIEGETNTAANQRADALDAQVVPHMGDFVSAATKPLDALMPSRWVGLLDKDYDGLSAVDRFSRLFDENNRGLFINDNPYGLFSKRYAEEHPYWAMAGNMAFDIASTPFIINGAKKAYNVGKTAYNNGKQAFQTIEPSIVRGDTAKDNIGFASLDTEINSKLPAALKAVKAMKKADADVAKMSEYHAKNVEAYNEATGSDIIAKPFRTDYSTREIKVLPKEEFNETVGRIKTNSPSADIENIGGLYHKRMDTVFLRNNGTPSTAYHEFLHSNYYGVTNPEVTKWRIRQLVDSQTEAKMSPTSKAYFLSESEFPVHLRQQGELMGINVGDPFPGEEAFDNLLHKYPARGASYYTKGVQEGASLEDKKLLWKALNGTLFGGIGAIAGTAYGASQQDNNVKAYGGLLELANKFKDRGSRNDYNTWKKKIKDYKGIIVDGDDTYDYYNFFKDNSQMAWDMLNDNPEAHFTDKYKTPNHPTYSNESIYSRTPYIQGGTWNDYSPTVMGQKWNYALSPSQVNSNWDVERTINYLAYAENEGAYVTDSNGRYPIVDGTVLGGTLAPVTITPNSHSQGGPLKTKLWNDLSMKEKSEMIRVAVNEGITDIGEIRNRYNEYAESLV